MTLQDFANIIQTSNKIRIMQGKEQLYAGWLGILTMQHNDGINIGIDAKWLELKDREVKHFAAVPEIRHKEWEERGLMPPIEPGELPQYEFSDLRMDLYFTFYL